MGNINYDSFYKFVVSIGLLFVILPFAAFVFLCTNSFDLNISETDLLSYTDTAQRVIRIKQSVPLIMEERAFWYVSIIFICLGIVLILWGLYQWYTLQKIDDILKKREAQKIEEVIKTKAQDMTQEQVINKNVSGESADFSGANAIKGFIIEQKYYNLIKELKPSYTVKNNIRIDKCEYDIIAFGNHFYDKDYVYEIKYLRRSIDMQRINDGIKQLEERRKVFAEKFNKLPYMVLVIVVPDDMYDNACRVVKEVKKKNNYAIEVMAESELLEK